MCDDKLWQATNVLEFCKMQVPACPAMLHMHQIFLNMSPQLVQQPVVKNRGCTHHGSSPRNTDFACGPAQRRAERTAAKACGHHVLGTSEEVVRESSLLWRCRLSRKRSLCSTCSVYVAVPLRVLLLGGHLRAAQRDNRQQHTAAEAHRD